MNSIIHDITKGKYSDKDDLTVLPIFGQPGIGKTTLTQFIYEKQEVKRRFDVKVWKCVPVNFKADKLLEDIMEYIPTAEHETPGTKQDLIDLIGERLKSKRFLLVLDDLWKSDEEEWKKLLLPFKKSQAKGNIIIVTTRFPALAEKIDTTNGTMELEGLEQQEFEQLFLAYIFGDQQPSKDHFPLLKIGKRIMDKLKGSPLAAKTVGRLLRTNFDMYHWTGVLKSKEWESATSENDIMPALKLSYDYLPFHLQQCFLYCALFPKGYEFYKENLIDFWIGLDVLQSDRRDKSIEDIGLTYLDDLVGHGFLKKEEENGHSYYLIHDLLHDLALSVAASDCLVINEVNERSLKIQKPYVRHLCIHMDDVDVGDSNNFESSISEILKELKIGRLQTLMVFGGVNERHTRFLDDLIRKAIGLRVLHLSEMSSRMEFSTLPHLRYLSLGSIYSREIHLPSMLSRFYHLRILDLEKWRGSFNLPRDMSNLKKLGHFRTKDDEVHSKICNVGELQFLQELKRFRVNKENNGFTILGSMNELRELGIYNLEKIHSQEDAIEADMLRKKHLQKLTLDWSIELPRNERDVQGLVLERLEPQRNLQELCIRGHGSRSCPTWLSSKRSLEVLKSLHLAGVEWEDLPSLEHMEFLHELELKCMSALKEFGPRHFGNVTEQSFCNLRSLKLIALKGFENWVMGGYCHLLSELKVLIIKDCPDLSGMPFEDSTLYPSMQDEEKTVHLFPNLQEFLINNCPKVVSLPPIPWTQTLSHIEIEKVGSPVLKSLLYEKSPFSVRLEIEGKDDLHNLDELWVFRNLTNLQSLTLKNCPALESRHFQMLTSLYYFKVNGSDHLFALSGNEDEVEWQIPVEKMEVHDSLVTGKELSHFLPHLPKLSELTIWSCKKITQMGATVVQQQPTTHVPLLSASSHQQQISEVVQEIEKVDDDLLLFPAHVSDSLRELTVWKCPEVSLVVSSPFLPNSSRAGRGGEGGGLQALRSLQRLEVLYCPKFLTAYNKVTLPYCFPFPSLTELKLWGTVGMETLQPLENLTSLTRLRLLCCGEDLRSDGLWPLITRGQLKELVVARCPSFFAGFDPTQGLKDEDQVQLLHRSSKLQELVTDDVAGFLVKSICRILSYSLTELKLIWDLDDEELLRFTEEQEEALQLLTSLKSLTFESFPKLQCLPAGLHTLPKLETLMIDGCELVDSLPRGGLPSSLRKLTLEDCGDELIQQCRSYIDDHPEIKLDVRKW